MNKTAIRNYAVWARTALIEAVTQKAFEYEIKDGEAIVKSVPNKSTVTKIVIPDEYEGVPVTKISDFSAGLYIQHGQRIRYR
mgnify:CR=1 FL=1